MATVTQRLSSLQASLLARACSHPEGRLLLDAQPDRPKAAFSSAVGALRRKGLVRKLGPNLWFLTETGRARDHTEPRSRGSAGPTASRAPARERLLVLLQQPDGVSISELVKATGWQAHSIRAALSSLRKSGLTIMQDRQPDGTRRYQVLPAAEKGER